MTVEMWMGLGIVVAIIGFIMWRVGLNMQAKRNRNAGMVTMIAWLLLIILPPDSNMYSRSTKMFREYINCLILSNSYFIFI